MTNRVPIGLALTMLAGILSGNCMLPAKFVRTWKWENLWGVFSVVSLIILPWALAVTLVAQLAAVYRLVTVPQLTVTTLFGAGWGIAQILFGISIKRLGLSIGYAIIVGLGAVMGTLVPLFVNQRNFVSQYSLTMILTGVTLMIVGIALVARGGCLREQQTKLSTRDQGYVAAISLAVLCGFMAPMLNYAFAFGQSIAQQATRLGNSQALAAYAVWPIALAGGFVPNAVYSLFLLSRNRSWALFCKPFPDGFWSSLMGVLWMSAFALYGMSATFLGVLGTSLGWGLFQIFMIVTATLSGVLTGEWKEAPRHAIGYLGAGLVSLAVATALLTLSNRPV